jgi:hypothetical protein
MKNYIYFFNYYRFSLLTIFITLLNCSGGDSGSSDSNNDLQPNILVSETVISFGQVYINTNSYSQSLFVSGNDLTDVIDVSVSGPYEISLNDENFSSNIQIPNSSQNEEVFIRFTPSETGLIVGDLSLTSGDNVLEEVTLTGTGVNIIHSYTAFNQQPLGFGGGFNQSASQVFSLHGDMSNIDKVKMFLQIDCPSSGCDDWDRFANVKVKDPASGSWFEIGRYITPYWVGTQQLDRGLEFDVTDLSHI